MGLTPRSWPPSQIWDGDDGSWSSFALRVGSSQDVVRVLPSTAALETWVVSPLGCPPGEPGTSNSTTCSDSRGGIFDPNQSSTWKPFGNYSLDIELNLGYNDSASLGLDTLTLGYNNANAGLKIGNQLIFAIATDDYYTGIFGLGHLGTNVSNFSRPYPSFLTSMKANDFIPSLSWAYTAGAPYQQKGVFGSLTFGGYDRSRFIPNNVSISLAPDNSRDLVLGLQAITSKSVRDSVVEEVPLLPTPILTFVDSTLPYIYLPIEACKQFESTLGLSWNETDAMYWVNETLHQRLISSHFNFTFTIGDTTGGGPTVDIVLPYASFDLEAKYPFALETTRYFPLQQARDEAEYTLGRSFLQEAYIITDYEHANFSVSQSHYTEDSPADLAPILSKDYVPNSTAPVPHAETPFPPKSKKIHEDVIIGTSIGATMLLVIALAAAIIMIRKRRHKAGVPKDHQVQIDIAPNYDPLPELDYGNGGSVREIGNNSLIGPYREAPDNELSELLGRHSLSNLHVDMPEGSVGINPMTTMLIDPNGDRSLFSDGVRTGNRMINGSIASNSSAETVNSAAEVANSPDTEIASVGTSNIEHEIYASYIRRSLDLNRSLPPTPVSESPQSSLCPPGLTAESSAGPGSQSLNMQSQQPRSKPRSLRIPISAYFPHGRVTISSAIAHSNVNPSADLSRVRNSKPSIDSLQERKTSWD